jgi:hypothetical protein
LRERGATACCTGVCFAFIGFSIKQVDPDGTLPSGDYVMPHHRRNNQGFRGT